MPIDETRTFVPASLAVLTISDSRQAAEDRSGDALAERIEQAGHRLAARAIVKDEIPAIRAQVQRWIETEAAQVIVTTGGTGITGRDVTPEALEPLFDKAIVGFGELFRWLSYQKVGTSTIQSRATAGIIKGVLVFALPGSPSAVKDGWDMILRDQLDSRHRPCNFIELLPRLREGQPA